MKKLRLFVLSCLFSFQAMAQVYKCQDENEQAIYQSVRCSEGRQTSIPLQRSYQPAIGIRASETQWLADRARLAKKTAKKNKSPQYKKQKVDQQEQRCWKKQQQLDVVRAKLRRGYKPAQGDRLRAKRRSYEGYLSKFCR